MGAGVGIVIRLDMTSKVLHCAWGASGLVRPSRRLGRPSGRRGAELRAACSTCRRGVACRMVRHRGGLCVDPCLGAESGCAPASGAATCARTPTRKPAPPLQRCVAGARRRTGPPDGIRVGCTVVGPVAGVSGSRVGSQLPRPASPYASVLPCSPAPRPRTPHSQDAQYVTPVPQQGPGCQSLLPARPTLPAR
jgi:hypothetical protein